MHKWLRSHSISLWRILRSSCNGGPFSLCGSLSFASPRGYQYQYRKQGRLSSTALAGNHPKLSVTFQFVKFDIDDVKGAIHNLGLDQAVEEETQRGGAVAAAENDVEDDADGVESDV
jgi:hypothetical protein